MREFTVGELTSIALCWTVERSDGAGIALTSHDAPVDLNGISCEPAAGMNPAAVVKGLGLEPQSSEVAGVLSTEALTADDLVTGRWDGARVRLSAADWSDPEAQPIQLLGGELGEVAIEGDQFSADLKGAAHKLSAPVCPSTSPECRAELGDKTCRVDLRGRSMRASVASVSGNLLTLDRMIEERFRFGRLRYLSGANCAVMTRILGVEGYSIRVRELPRQTVEQDCRVELREGCDKRLATCSGRFGNVANFRGEPHLPGNDLLTRYPGA